MEIQSTADESLAIIEKLRNNIENIHKAKHNRWNRELVGLLQQNKSLIMHLRRKQRELSENIEGTKDLLAAEIEKTDEMHSVLENLEYEKICIENETARIKKLDTKELKELGISITGEKTEILQRLQEEFMVRNELKKVFSQKEVELENEKKLLGLVETKIRILSDSIRKIDVAAESLSIHVITDS